MALTDGVVLQTIHFLYGQINRRRAWPMLAICVPKLRLTVAGDTALGGEFQSRRQARLWFARLFRLTKSLDIHISDTDITGSLADMSVSVTWSDRVTMSDGKVFVNHGVHEYRLRWGFITSVVFNWDEEQVVRSCDYCATVLGLPEAAAPPLPVSWATP